MGEGNFDIPGGDSEQFQDRVKPNDTTKVDAREAFLAQQLLMAEMISKITSVAEDWKKAHGMEDQSLDEISKGGTYDNIILSEIQFEQEWHNGAVLGSDAFRLLQIDGLMGEQEFWGEELTQRLDKQTVEEQIASHLKRLILLTKAPSGRIDEWYINFLPDAPPFAVNTKDAIHLGYQPIDPRASIPIKETFGEEAVPFLTAPEMRLLTSAVKNTPAKVFTLD